MKVIAIALCVLVGLSPADGAFVESAELRRDALQHLDAVSARQPKPPISVHAGEYTNLLDPEEPLSLGKPISFESPLFKGKILIRLKNALSSDHDPENHAKYFRPDRKKRLMQLVVQGQFKKPTKMSDIYVGSVMNEPLARMPPAFVTKVLEKALRRFHPGSIVDLQSHQPRVMAIYAGSAQSVSIDPPDEELPDILAPDIAENSETHLPFGGCSDQRILHLSKPEHASNYEFDTNHVYTFHSYNEFLDFGTGTVHVPLLGPYDMKSTVGPQPFKFNAVSGEGETVYSFEIRQ